MAKFNLPKYYILALALPIFLASLSTSITNIAVPSLMLAFDTTFTQVQWVIVAYLVTLTSAAIMTGSLADRVDLRVILLSSLSLFLFSSILCGFSPSINWLIGYRIVQGVAAAGMMNSTMALIAGLNAKNKAGFAMGLIGSLSAIGTATGPTLGGFLINLWGWQAIFLINIPIAAIALFLVFSLIPKNPLPKNPRKPIDFLGIFVLTITIAVYVFSLVNWGQYSYVFMVLALIGIITFVIIEKQSTHPALSITLLKQPALLIGSTLSLLVATVMMTTLVIGPFYLLKTLELTPWQMGMVMSCGPIAAACLGLPAGKLVDKIGANNVIIYALTCMVSGFTLLAYLAQHLSVALYILFTILITSGYAAFQAANNKAILFDIDSSQKALLSGIINLSRNLGLINGAALMTTLFAYAAGNTLSEKVSSQSVVNGFQLTFSVSAALMMIAIVLILLYTYFAKRKAT